MRLTIENKSKLEIFVSIFQLLKHWNSHISMHFETDRLYIQSMDKSHICLADIEIKKNWFSNYDTLKNNNIAVDSNHFAILMNYALKNDSLELKFEDEYEPDKLYINFLNGKENKTSFDHFFELNLIDVDEEGLGIPSVDYDVEFTIESKKFVDTLSELNTFGQNLSIKCDENVIELNSNSDSTKLKIHIPVEQLDEYAIAEEQEVSVAFSLTHLCKMCTSIKLSEKINVSVSNEYPMLLLYNLGDDSKVSFFIAPKVSD
jgi:proliferating cell nuclear antigen PCNA